MSSSSSTNQRWSSKAGPPAPAAWVRKGDDERLVNLSDVPRYLKDKYEEFTPAAAAVPAVATVAAPKPIPHGCCWVRKEDEERLIRVIDLKPYEKDGWEEFRPEIQVPVAGASGPVSRAGEGLIHMKTKEGADVLVEPAKVDQYKASGHDVAAEAQGAQDHGGRNEQPGRALGQEHGQGGHVEKSVDNPKRKQRAGAGGNGPEGG